MAFTCEICGKQFDGEYCVKVEFGVLDELVNEYDLREQWDRFLPEEGNAPLCTYCAVKYIQGKED